MKKFTYALACLAIALLFASGSKLLAQSTWDFEGMSIGDSVQHIGWSVSDIQAVVAADPLASGNHVLKNTIHNYNAAPVLPFTLPAGKTLADYKTFKFKSYWAQGDVGYKDIIVEAYQTMPTAQAYNNTANKIGSVNRAQMGSTAWEDITIDITNTRSFSGTIYVAFGINCAGTGNIGGSGVTTIWYADNVQLVATSADTTLVNQWGTTPRGTAWPILNTAATPPGSGSMGADARPTAWASIKGGFSTLTPTTSKALVISGTFEFVGGGGNNAYTWLRYALFYGEGALSGQNTPTAAWSETSNAWGYEFDPVSGTGTVANGVGGGTGGQGTEWYIINSKSWTSTNSNGGGPISTIYQAPARQVATAGVYDWAISVQPQSNGSNQVNWYFVQQHAAGSSNYYWWGGTFVDPTPVTSKFNSIGFAVNNDVDATCKQVNLATVRATLGSPITVPEAPWQAFYITDWGQIGNRTGGWHVVPDPEGLVGNCSIAGDKVPTGNWATIRGGFAIPVTATTSKAIIVTGSVEFVGSGPVTWSGLRYGLFRHDSVGTVQYANTDSARWGKITSGTFAWGSESYAYGYMFTPQSGTTYAGNIPGGTAASQGITTGGSWVSTYGGAVGFGGLIPQAPARAIFDAGKYDFAFSVQPQADGTNEVRFYMIKQAAAGQQTTYWYGGTLIDPLGITKTFNGICFGLDPNYDQTTSPISALKLSNVKVDLGSPITVPEAPFSAYYLSDWGFYGGKTGGWTLTPGDIIGNATISGTGPNVDLSSVRASFVSSLKLKADKALTVTGKVEFVGGGFEAWGTLRCGIFYSSNPGTEAHNSGYLFLPQSGSNGPLSWDGTPGTWGGVIDGIWRNTGGGTTYVLGTDLQSPAKAVGSAGVYDFTISIAPAGTGKSEVSFTLVKSDKSYSFTVKGIDSHSPLASTQFNGFAFALNHGNATTAVNFTDVKVDLVDHIVSVQEPPAGTIPTEYALGQNYPNPFNPSTTIGYDIPKNSQVSVKVYDVLGRLVATLVDGVQSASSYRVEWNPSGLSSGVYFYRIQAQSLDGSGNFVAVKKLVFMK
jgi:hypothetical protein